MVPKSYVRGAAAPAELKLDKKLLFFFNQRAWPVNLMGLRRALPPRRERVERKRHVHSESDSSHPPRGHVLSSLPFGAAGLFVSP